MAQKETIILKSKSKLALQLISQELCIIKCNHTNVHLPKNTQLAENYV